VAPPPSITAAASAAALRALNLIHLLHKRLARTQM
jgi:hypothetical protein